MTEAYKFVKQWVEPNAIGSLPIPVIRDAMCSTYESRPELQFQSIEDWQSRMLGYLTARMRCEVVVYHGEVAIGATSLAITDDIHVGATLEVLATFIAHEHRSVEVIKGLLRESKAIAKSLGLKTLSVSKYQGPYRYSLRYIPIS